jgi:hypothetical protein
VVLVVGEDMVVVRVALERLGKVMLVVLVLIALLVIHQVEEAELVE